MTLELTAQELLILASAVRFDLYHLGQLPVLMPKRSAERSALLKKLNTAYEAACEAEKPPRKDQETPE